MEQYITRYLAIPQSPPLEDFKEIVHYSLHGGKKLRAILALEFYLSLSWKNIWDIAPSDDIIKVCCAIEILHAFSLIHDDLPCMDNDELRRWEPTVWKKYGEFQAVLVGDMLQSLCFELISDIKDPCISQEVAKLISSSVGFYGMSGWQIEDMYYEWNPADLTQTILTSLHLKKTWKLIEASIIAWCLIARDRSNIDIYGEFWKKLWLAFQLKDDILDVEGTPEETGKSVGWEEKWFVYLVGLEKSKELLEKEIQDCLHVASKLGSEKITFLVHYVANRKT